MKKMTAARPWAPHPPVTDQIIMVYWGAGKLTLGSDDLDLPPVKVKFEPGGLKVSLLVFSVTVLEFQGWFYRFIGNNAGITYLHDRMQCAHNTFKS